MNVTIIDTIYDLYLKSTEKGDLYEVPVKFKSKTSEDDSDDEDIVLQVWATSEEEAEERAARQAQAIEMKKNRTIKEKSLGILLPANHYHPKKITKAWKLWKDPSYQKAKNNIFAPSGYAAGTMLKLSLSPFLKPKKDADPNKKISEKRLIRTLNTNIISFFIWFGLFLIGLLFAALGIQYLDSPKFYLKWVNPFLIAGIVCLLLSLINLFKAHREHKIIKRTIAKMREDKKLDNDMETEDDI